MSGTMYLRNSTEIAAAARVAKALGYMTSQRDIRDHDRYVGNIAQRLAGGALSDQRKIYHEIERAVMLIRNEHD